MRIKDIPIADRPRERFLSYGVENLSNEEILSILLKTGSRTRSVRELAMDILAISNGLDKLSEITKEQLLEIDGIGIAKSLEILCAIELGKRIHLKPKLENSKLGNAGDIYEMVKYLFYDKKQEYFYCIYLNNKNEAIERRLLFMGTINRSLVHPREVFKYAYLASASSIVCVHNHPSGDVSPSREDIRLTKALVELGKLNSIPIVDHVIVGEDNYYSFYEEGKILNL